MATAICPLRTIFSEHNQLAWDILECEANLQVFPSVDGREIVTLLGHYMRAVQLLNSVQDRRQQFFKARMSSLMLRPTVVRSINKQTFKERARQQPSEIMEAEQVQRTAMTDLQSRKQQLAVQLAYHNDRNSKDELARMMCVEYNRSDKLKEKISEIIKGNDKRIMERIRNRKIRALELREERYHKEGSCESDDQLTTVEEFDSPIKRNFGRRAMEEEPGRNYCQDKTEI